MEKYADEYATDTKIETVKNLSISLYYIRI